MIVHMNLVNNIKKENLSWNTNYLGLSSNSYNMKIVLGWIYTGVLTSGVLLSLGKGIIVSLFKFWFVTIVLLIHRKYDSCIIYNCMYTNIVDTMNARMRLAFTE